MRSSPPRSRFAAVLLDDSEDPLKRNANTTIHSNSNSNHNSNNSSQRSRRGNHNTRHSQYKTATEEEAGGVSSVYAFATNNDDALPPVSVSSSTAASSTGNTMCCAKSLKDSLSQDNSTSNSNSRRRRAKSPLSCLTVNFRSKHKETPSQSEEPLTPKKKQQYSLQQPKQKSTTAGMNSPQRNSHTREYYSNDLPEASPRKVYQRLPESDRCKTPTPSYSFQPILLEAGDDKTTTLSTTTTTTAELALINQKKKSQNVHNNNNNNHQFPQYHSADRQFQHQNHYHHHASSHAAFPVDHQDAHSVANTSVSSSMSYLERTRSVLESIKKEKLQRRAAQLIQEQEQLEKEQQSDQKQPTKEQKGMHHFQMEKLVPTEKQSRVPPIEMEDLAEERIQASHCQQSRNDRVLDVPVKQHQANSKEVVAVQGPSTQWKSESEKQPTMSSTQPTMDNHVSSAVSTTSSSANGHGPISTRVQEVLRRSKRRSMSPKNETVEQRRRGRSLSRTQTAWKAKQQQSNNTSSNSTQSISSSEQESSPPSIIAQSSTRRKSSRSRSRADVARNKAQLLSGKHHENASQASNDVKEESHNERGMNTTQDSGIIDENVFGAPFHENPFNTASAPELTNRPAQQRQDAAYWSFGNPVAQEFKQEMTRGPVPPSEEPISSPQESPGKHSSCEKSFISGLTKDSTTAVSSLEASTMSGGPIARERSRSRSSSQKARHRSRSVNRLPNRSEVLKRAEANAKVLSNWEGNDVEVESFKSVQRPEAEDGADPNLAPLTPVREITRQQSKSKLAAAALRMSPQRPPSPPPSAPMTMVEAHTGNADDDNSNNVVQDEVKDERSELESLLGQIDKYGDKKRISQQTEPPLECFEEVFSISAATTEDEDVEKPQKPSRSSTSSYKADQLLGDLDSQISVPTIEDDEYGQGDGQASSILKIHHDESTISSLSNPTFADSLPSESTSSPPHPVESSPPSILAKAMFNIQETSTGESQYKEDIQNYIGQMALFKDYQLRHDSLPAPEQPSAADVIPQLQESSLDTTITGNDDDDEEDEVIEHIPLSRTETVPQEWKHHAAMEDERNTTLNTSAEYSSMSEAIRTVPRADFTTRAIME